MVGRARFLRSNPTVTALGLAVTLSGQMPHSAGAQAVDCGNAATQMDMNICAAQEFDAADGDLNATYQLAMSEWLGGRDTSNGQALLAAQRAWLAYRDAHCAAAASIYEGGSIQPMIYSLCLTDLTRTRTELIRTYAEPY